MRFIFIAASVVFAGLAACGEKQTDPSHEPKPPPAVTTLAAPPTPAAPAAPPSAIAPEGSVPAAPHAAS